VRSERGQGIVETALTLPLLFTLFFGVIEFSLVVLSYNTIANAAREGARFGVVAPNNVAGMESAARRHVTAVQCSGAGMTVTPSRPTADTVRVEVQCDLPLMTQMMVAALGGRGTIPLHASATMHVE
jgi:Flp pilus assembly protein TadG